MSAKTKVAFAMVGPIAVSSLLIAAGAALELSPILGAAMIGFPLVVLLVGAVQARGRHAEGVGETASAPPGVGREDAPEEGSDWERYDRRTRPWFALLYVLLIVAAFAARGATLGVLLFVMGVLVLLVNVFVIVPWMKRSIPSWELAESGGS